MNEIRFGRIMFCLIVFSTISLWLGCDAGAPRQSSEDYEREKSQHATEKSDKQRQKDRDVVIPVDQAFSRLLAEALPHDPPIGMTSSTQDEQANVQKSQKFLDQIGSIDVSQCPKGYQDAFQELSNCWKNFHQKVIANNGKVIDRAKPISSGLQSKTYAGITRIYEGVRTNDPALTGILNSIKTASSRYDGICRNLRLPGLW